MFSFFVQHEGDEGQLPHAGTFETLPRSRGLSFYIKEKKIT